jgi:hypothetical protein
MAFQNCTASIKTAATPKQTIKIFLVVSDMVFTPRARNHIPPPLSTTRIGCASQGDGSNGRASIGAGATNRRWGFESVVRIPMPPGQHIRRVRRCALLNKVQSVDQRMRLGMRCRLSPTADVPSHTSGAAMGHEELWAEICAIFAQANQLELLTRNSSPRFLEIFSTCRRSPRTARACCRSRN